MSQLGNYQLIARVGHGGMAEVFLGLASGMQGFQKLMVLKTLKPELSADPEFIEMFLAEARVAALLNHPNIVQTYEVGSDNGRPFIAMEYLEGQPLSAILVRVGRAEFPVDLHVHVLAQMLGALHYAHEATDLNGRPLAIVHRDVSPQNVFVTYAGQVKLLDFGIAKLSSSASFTKQGVVKGKVGYMAPEQAFGSPLDRRADVFAAGVMLWEALMKRRLVLPTDDDSLAIQRRLAGNDPPPSSVRSEDTVLVEICKRAMAASSSGRFDTADAMREALDEWLGRPAQALERKLARLVEGAFERERSQLKKLVEVQLAQAGTAREVSLIEIEAPASASGSSRDAAIATAAATVPAPAPAESEPVDHTRADTPKRHRLRGVVAIGAVLCVVAGAVAVSRAPAAKGAVEAAAQPAAPSIEAMTAAEVPGARVRLSTSPPSASLVLDERPIANPFDGPVARGAHRLRASAPGYEVEERSLSVEADLVMELALRPAMPTPAPTQARSDGDDASRSPTRGSRKPNVNTRPAALGIDEKDPYR